MEAFVNILVSTVLESVTGLLTEKLDFIRKANQNLEELKRKLEKLQTAFKDMDHKLPFLSDERDRDEEEKLKDFLYEAEDIIDDYRTKIELSERNKVRKPWISVSLRNKLGNLIKNFNQSYKNEKIDDLLNKWSTRTGKGHVTGNDKPYNPRETTHHMGTIQVPTDRKRCKDEVKQLLLDGSSSAVEKRDVSIVSIIGKGGIGKTTIAKTVFNEVEQEFGRWRWWVCVSENPNGSNLLQKILKEVCKDLDHNTITSISLSDVHTRLESELANKKFLLVLDDVWDIDWWKHVKGTLMVGAVGSKILITSRNIIVSRAMGAQVSYQLPEMTFNDSWSLFLELIGMQENELVSKNLKDIGEAIVRKCDGLPLAIQTVGYVMCTKDMTRAEWNEVVDNEIWDWKISASSSSSKYGDILPAVILSYDHLPDYYLKSCFVYCCIFPKDHHIRRNKLIMQWVAHGLVEKKKDSDVEVTANGYVDDLINRCLIEEVGYERLKLHDILHDLASYIGGKRYSHALSNEHTRHLSLLGWEDPTTAIDGASRVANKLRTLLGNHVWHYNRCHINVAHLTNFKWLRVLSLKYHWKISTELLDCITQNLILLKYLDLSYTGVTHLPSSIGRLYNLQTLKLEWSQIEELPKEMGELLNLRHLDLEGTRNLKFIAGGLGKLTNLQTLKRIIICDDKENEKGCHLRELGRLSKLKRKLTIDGLGGTRKTTVVEKQELPSMPLLKSLEIENCGVFNTICHMPALEELKIKDCPALQELSSMPLLNSLEIKNCDVLKAISHMPVLELLKVTSCQSMRQITDMPLLKSLEIKECEGDIKIGHMPALEELKVTSCQSIRQIPDMPSLKSLEMYMCEGLDTIGHMPALEELRVTSCQSIRKIPDMPLLKSLEIEKCEGLNTIGHVPALKSLELWNVDSLKQLPTGLSSLEKLSVWGMANLEGWPTAGTEETTVSFMPCLRQMTLFSCPRLETRGLLYTLSNGGHDSDQTQLESLEVRGCPNARLEWKLLKQLPNLIHLTVDMEALESRWSSLLPSEVSTFLPSLNLLDLELIEGDDYLKWGGVPEWVWGLSNLKTLCLVGFGDQELSLGRHCQCLPKLTTLHLFSFRNLRSLVDMDDRVAAEAAATSTTTASSAMASKQQITRLSKLERLSIGNCNDLLELPQELIDLLGERLQICTY